MRLISTIREKEPLFKPITFYKTQKPITNFYEIISGGKPCRSDWYFDKPENKMTFMVMPGAKHTDILPLKFLTTSFVI